MASDTGDIKAYNPALVVMLGVNNKTGEEKLFSAADVNALRSDINSDFDKGDWDFSCPCCGDAATAKHVIDTKPDESGQHAKSTHWRLKKDNWHSDSDCEMHSPLEAYLRRNGLAVQRRASDNLHELRIKTPSIKDVGGAFEVSSPPKRKRSHNKRPKLKYVSVQDIEALYHSLDTEARKKVLIRTGKTDKKLLSDFRLDTFNDLVETLGVKDRDSFIVPVAVNWSDYGLSSEHDGYYDVAANFDGVDLDLLVAEDVIALYEGGRIHHDQGMVIRIDAMRTDLSGDEAVAMRGIVNTIKDFAQCTARHAEPGIGGIQFTMPLQNKLA